jgi:bis(5'-nucleosidyl)-tetraphosphatase
VVDERSAGAVLYYSDTENDNIEYLLLHYVYGHWDFPKGNIETGEDEMAAAKREIREETGISEVEFVGGFKNSIEYHYRRSDRVIHKRVLFYIAKAKMQTVRISFEHIGYKWTTYQAAMDLLTYKNAKEILKKANSYLMNLM